MKPAEVLEAIHAAFNDSVNVSSDRIVNSKELEPLMVKQLLSSRTWREVSTEVLFGYDQRADLSAVIAFLTDDANRYYLPAFMIYVLCRGKDAGLIVDVLLSRLSTGSQGLSPSFFSGSQRNAVRTFLSALRQLIAEDESAIVQIVEAERLWST